MQEYELREYPASTWACTREEFDPAANDVFADWRVKYRGDPFAVMNSAAWEDQVGNKMFMRIFKYIVGVNQEGKEIKMTRPVTMKRKVRVVCCSQERLSDRCFCRFWVTTA